MQVEERCRLTQFVLIHAYSFNNTLFGLLDLYFVVIYAPNLHLFVTLFDIWKLLIYESWGVLLDFGLHLTYNSQFYLNHVCHDSEVKWLTSFVYL